MVQLQRNLELANNLALFLLLSMLVFSCSRPSPRPGAPRAVDFRRQVTHGPPPSFHVAWKKPRRCQPLCTPPNQDARLKWRLWLDFRCPASHFSCLRCSFLMFIFDEEIHSNSYLMTREYHPDVRNCSTHVRHSLAGLFLVQIFMFSCLQCSSVHIICSILLPRLGGNHSQNRDTHPIVQSLPARVPPMHRTASSDLLMCLIAFTVVLCTHLFSHLLAHFPSEAHTQAIDVSSTALHPACRFIGASRPDRSF